jgi:hypothetical protein
VLPESLDSVTLQRIAIGVLIGLAVLSLLVFRFVQKMATRLILFAIIVGLAAVVWMQRAELGDCAQTCDCRLLGQDVRVPRLACDDQLN